MTSTTHHLDRLSQNWEDTAEFLGTPHLPYVLEGFFVPEGYELLFSSNSDHDVTTQNIRLIYLKGIEPETVYSFALKTTPVKSSKFNTKTMTTLRVWNSHHTWHNKMMFGFAGIMFRQLLNKHTVLVSDTEQAESDKRFWLYRLGESIRQSNCKVSYYDKRNFDEQMQPILERITEQEALISHIELAWNAEEYNKNSVFIIAQEVANES